MRMVRSHCPHAHAMGTPAHTPYRSHACARAHTSSDAPLCKRCVRAHDNVPPRTSHLPRSGEPRSANEAHAPWQDLEGRARAAGADAGGADAGCVQVLLGVERVDAAEYIALIEKARAPRWGGGLPIDGLWVCACSCVGVRGCALWIGHSVRPLCLLWRAVRRASPSSTTRSAATPSAPFPTTRSGGARVLCSRRPCLHIACHPWSCVCRGACCAAGAQLFKRRVPEKSIIRLLNSFVLRYGTTGARPGQFDRYVN